VVEMIIRWVCEKDKKKWLYPIEKCIYCRQPVKKVITKKSKIIGITKVNIPSPMHPIIPYYILLLEDENGNRLPKKVMKERFIGQAYELKPVSNINSLIIMKIKYDVKSYLEESMKLIPQYHLNPDEKILIKVSAIEPAYSYQSVTTNPKMLDALISYLKGQGVKNIEVAEQSWPGYDTMKSIKKSGLLDVCKKHSVGFLDLSKEDYEDLVIDGLQYKIAKCAFSRKVINLPVMKTNSQIVISGALENMMRFTDSETQRMMFNEGIEKTLPQLIKKLPKFLSIGDATIGMEGQGPTSSGEPAFLNMLFISGDPVALDTAFIEMGMLPIPKYIQESQRIGVGSKASEVVGDELNATKFYLKPAERNAGPHPNIFIIDGMAPPNILSSALKISSKLLGLLGNDINLVIGSHLDRSMFLDKDRLVFYGKDAIRKIEELGLNPLAAIPEEMDEIEKISILKGILEDPEKKSLNIADKIKSKIAKYGSKLMRN
jgi:uncharacterized protein (DUF362 family)